MSFNCFKCSKTFSDLNSVVAHLRKIELMKERCDPIYCVKNSACKKYFYSYGGLRNHAKKCVNNEPISVDSIRPENTTLLDESNSDLNSSEVILNNIQ